MDLSLQLFGYLILTVLGIVVPFLIILLSIFQEGILKLTEQYEKERENSKKNIDEQLAKQSKAKKKDYNEIEKSLKQLRIINKKAKRKLSYLNPKNQIVRLFIILFISFLGVILAILKKTIIFGIPIFILISLLSFIIALYILWKLLCILIEVRKIIDRNRNKIENKTLELLSTIAKKGENYFLENVFLSIKDVIIKNDDKEIKLYSDTKESLPIKIENDEIRMVKNIEAGIIFPRDFIIDESDRYSIYTDTDGKQIVRYTSSLIHGNTTFVLTPLIIKPIKEGEYVITTFINAENIESTYRTFKLIIKEEIEEEIEENNVPL